VGGRKRRGRGGGENEIRKGDSVFEAHQTCRINKDGY